MMRSDLNKFNGRVGEALSRIINETCIEYKQCFIERTLFGFKWGGEDFLFLEDAQAEIDKSLQTNTTPPVDYYKTHLEVTIVGNDGQETVLSKECKEQYIIGRSPWMMYKNQQA